MCTLCVGVLHLNYSKRISNIQYISKIWICLCLLLLSYFNTKEELALFKLAHVTVLSNRPAHMYIFHQYMSNAFDYLSIGEACWWTIHPASKQRSEGEKVRIGDDLILVSVSTERYLVSPPHGFSIQ